MSGRAEAARQNQSGTGDAMSADSIRDLFSAQVERTFAGSDERMYRTGDSARVGRDGAIIHVGRADDQVKIRGFRVELAAVEAALAGHPGVDQVVVVATDVDLDAKRLVAYVVSKSAVDVDSVRAHASRTLPDYMVPSTVAGPAALIDATQSTAA
ncbi:AMP-binding enzyme [Amycolatopsis sp. lyj-109]|uniref:AMP-binding enzyme n=1 Tax=Amycolatopsis sp. lyj-109 TaxID=2789287 RepID=UPI003979BA1D